MATIANISNIISNMDITSSIENLLLQRFLHC